MYKRTAKHIEVSKRNLLKAIESNIGRPSALKGRKISAEHKQKISLALKGKVPKNLKIVQQLAWESRKGVSPPNKGKGKLYFQRPQHNGWAYKNFVLKVLQRDDYTCQFCGQRGGELNADHIIQFAKIVKEEGIKILKDAINCKRLWDINNGRTLCVPCHQKTQTYGYKLPDRREV